MCWYKYQPLVQYKWQHLCWHQMWHMCWYQYQPLVQYNDMPALNVFMLAFVQTYMLAQNASKPAAISHSVFRRSGGREHRS